jgi:beta-lactamase class A
MKMSPIGLEKSVFSLAKHVQGTVGLAIKHVQSNECVFMNENRLFPTASVFKVPVLVELFSRVKSKRIRLDQKAKMKESDKSPGSGVLKELHAGMELTVKDLATMMTIISDNTATDMLTDLLDIEAINSTMRHLGYRNTRVVMNCKGILFNLVGINPQTASRKQLRRGWELLKQGKINPRTRALSTERNNVSTPYEMMCIFEDLLKHRILDNTCCEGILDILKRQQLRTRIPLLLPETLTIAHKTGTLRGIRNDSGIVYLPNSQLIISVFTKKVRNPLETDRTIGEISKKAYDHYLTIDRKWRPR